MPVAKTMPPGPIAMKRGPLRPAAKTFASKPGGRVRVRGLGLMAAVQLAPVEELAKLDGKVGSYLKDHGIITRVKGGAIYLAPPLVISEDQVDRTVNTIEGRC